LHHVNWSFTKLWFVNLVLKIADKLWTCAVGWYMTRDHLSLPAVQTADDDTDIR